MIEQDEILTFHPRWSLSLWHNILVPLSNRRFPLVSTSSKQVIAEADAFVSAKVHASVSQNRRYCRLAKSKQ